MGDHPIRAARPLPHSWERAPRLAAAGRLAG